MHLRSFINHNAQILKKNRTKNGHEWCISCRQIRAGGDISAPYAGPLFCPAPLIRPCDTRFSLRPFEFSPIFSSHLDGEGSARRRSFVSRTQDWRTLFAPFKFILWRIASVWFRYLLCFKLFVKNMTVIISYWIGYFFQNVRKINRFLSCI